MSNEQETPAAATFSNNTTEYVEADEDPSLSDLGSSIVSDLTSLSSSVREHIYENGRRYHSLSAGTYAIPNDENEQDRLDMFHHLISLLLEGALHVVALPDKLDRILDLGTGTGIWAIDMADAHPSAHVIGVDLSPIQPAWVPPNCVFEVDDLEKPWLWKEPFDFIHSQNIAQGIRDWPLYMKRIYDNLTPGGVVQLLEARMFFESDDNTLPKGGAVEQYFDAFKKASVLAGIKDQADEMEGHLRELGYEDVRTVVKKMPIGPWPKDPKKKEQGRWGMAIVEQGFRAYGSAMFTRLLGMSPEEADELCDNGFKECRQRGVHCYNAQVFVEGRKPFAVEAAE